MDFKSTRLHQVSLNYCTKEEGHDTYLDLVFAEIIVDIFDAIRHSIQPSDCTKEPISCEDKEEDYHPEVTYDLSINGIGTTDFVILSRELNIWHFNFFWI